MSALQTLTRLPVTLCVADCTRQGPTLKGGEWAAAGSDAPDDDGVGVDVRLRMEPEPILYDCEMLVRPKNEEAAASMLSSYVYVANAVIRAVLCVVLASS